MSYSVWQKATSELITILDFWRYGISKAIEKKLYYGHGTDNAQDDIWSLISGSLQLPYTLDPIFLQARLTAEEKEKLMLRLLARIEQRIPVPYILQSAQFCDLTFYVDERVLIPRSPIAELIQQQFEPWVDPESVHRVLDLCTGSACIAIACCYAFPEAVVDAVDISRDALDVAEMNRQNHGLEATLELIQSDCWDNVPLVQYDIIVSNPPYVGDEEMRTLPEEYRHEPDLALRTANNGLWIVDKILKKAHDYLTDNGILIVEVGNSDEALSLAYPDLPFLWLEFEHGGHGVFLLTKAQLAEIGSNL